MKFFEFVLVALFILGCFVGAIWAKTYLIPRFAPSIAQTATETVAQGVA